MLIPYKDLLAEAQAGGYAVGYFEAWDIYSLEAVLDAAETEGKPVILGFGGTMMEPAWFDDRGLERLAALGLATAQSARVPVSFLLNEVSTFSQVVRGIRAGFNAVMLEASCLPFAENVRLTRKVVEVAHAAGVGVEGELGALPDATGEMAGHQSSLTDPDEARRFVMETGVDALSVSIPVQLMGKVGDDFSGQIIRQLIAAQDPGLCSGMIVDPAANTSYTIVISPPGIDRILFHSPGANDTFSAADIRYDLLAETDLFHFGYPPLMQRMYAPDGAQLADIFRRVHSIGVTTSLDMAFPGGHADWSAILGMALPDVDIFMPSIEEILLMLHRSKYEALLKDAEGGDILPLITPGMLSELSRELLEMGAKIVGLKLGYRGLYLRTADALALADMGRAGPSHPEAWADQELWSACFVVEVVGTAGSGDATIAGLLSAILHDLDPRPSLNTATWPNWASSISTTGAGTAGKSSRRRG